MWNRINKKVNSQWQQNERKTFWKSIIKHIYTYIQNVLFLFFGCLPKVLCNNRSKVTDFRFNVKVSTLFLLKPGTTKCSSKGTYGETRPLQVQPFQAQTLLCVLALYYPTCVMFDMVYTQPQPATVLLPLFTWILLRSECPVHLR